MKRRNLEASSELLKERLYNLQQLSSDQNQRIDTSMDELIKVSDYLYPCKVYRVGSRISEREDVLSIKYAVYPHDFQRFPQNLLKCLKIGDPYQNSKASLEIPLYQNELISFAFGRAPNGLFGEVGTS